MFFIFPQAWITPAIAAAALHFGSVGRPVEIKYQHLDGNLAQVKLPNKIIVDKRPESEWPKARAQCVLVHEYGHLLGRKHSKKSQSIMYPILRYRVCIRWLKRHHVY